MDLFRLTANQTRLSLYKLQLFLYMPIQNTRLRGNMILVYRSHPVLGTPKVTVLRRLTTPDIPAET